MFQAYVMQRVANTLRKINHWLTYTFSDGAVKKNGENCVLNDVACELAPVENMNIVVKKLLKVKDIDVFYAELTPNNDVPSSSESLTFDKGNCKS